MKKTGYTFFVVGAVIALASCVKETIQNESPNNFVLPSDIPTEIVCEIDQETTKTQYAENKTFGWTKNDQVRMPVVKWSGSSITACDFYTFTTLDASGSASATFILNGTSGTVLDNYNPNPNGVDGNWTSLGYLVYPSGLFNKEYDGNKPVVNLPASIVYNNNTPLDGEVVPMIGRKDGDKYKFHTAVGIIKLTISNAPSAGKKIKLVSTDKPIAGKFTISDVDDKISQVANTSAKSGEGVNELLLTGLSLTAGEQYDFYLPVPVGSYSAKSLTISILDDKDLPLLEQTIARELNIARNEVLSIPTLLYHRVYIKGSLSDPRLYTENPYSKNGTIRTIISRDKLTKDNYNIQNWPSGNKFQANQDAWQMNGHKDFLMNETESGLFYLQYIVCTNGNQPTALSDDNVAIYGSVPFYFAPASKKIPVTESWLNVPYVSTAEGSVANLVDGNTGTYWHSPYGSENPARNATYGQIISVDLNEGTSSTDGEFYFSFCTRSGAINNHAKVIDIYVSNVRWDEASFDTDKVKVGSTTNALEGIYPYSGTWIKSPIICSGSGSYRYITVSILKGAYGDAETDLRNGDSTHMAEIEFYKK